MTYLDSNYEISEVITEEDKLNLLGYLKQNIGKELTEKTQAILASHEQNIHRYYLYQKLPHQENKIKGFVVILTDGLEEAIITDFSLVGENFLGSEPLQYLGTKFLRTILEDKKFEKIRPYKWFVTAPEAKLLFEKLGLRPGLDPWSLMYTYDKISDLINSHSEKELPSTIKITNDKERFNNDEVLALLRTTYWGKEFTKHYADTLIQNSFCYYAYDQESNKLVGFLREVTDNRNISSLWDLVVHSEYRKNGIGTALVKISLENFCRKKLQFCILMGSEKDIQNYRKIAGYGDDYDLPNILLKFPYAEDIKTLKDLFRQIQQRFSSVSPFFKKPNGTSESPFGMKNW